MSQSSGIDASLPLSGIENWMNSVGLPGGPVRDVVALEGGTQNVMVRLTRGERSYVLRRGPRHMRARTNAALTREIRVLGALAETDVPHPRLVASCTDVGVLGDSVFYLMEPVDGFNAGVELPPAQAQDEAMRRDMGFAFIDALTAIARVDPVAVGLEDFGKPGGFLARQVGRWKSELSSYSQLNGYDPASLESLDDIATWLEIHQPESTTPGLLHGDYHLSNVMFDRNSPQIVAVVDWEMATLGDPLIDLGWVLAVWPEKPGEPDLFGSALSRAGGLPSQAEVVSRYAARVDRDLSHITWYTVLACFKLGILLEGTYARSQAGLAPPELGRVMRTNVLSLVRRARARMAGHWLTEPSPSPKDSNV